MDRLGFRGVELHENQRVRLPEDFEPKRLARETLVFQNGGASFEADLVLWCVGQVEPNSSWLPAQMLDERGFVRVDSTLRTSGEAPIYAVGDIAATDPLRSSARNQGHVVVAKNLRAELEGRGGRRSWKPPAYRWGSVFGLEEDGLRVYTPRGGVTRIPRFLFEKFIMPVIVNRGIYGGIASRDDSRLRD